MMNLKAVVGVLLMGAVAFAAPAGAPTVAIDASSIEFDVADGEFAFNVIITGLGSGVDGFHTSGDPLIDNILGIDIGVQVTGPAMANLLYTPVNNQLPAGFGVGSWDDIIDNNPGGKSYLFPLFSNSNIIDGLAVSDAAAVAVAGGTVYKHGMLDERTVAGGFEGVAPVANTVVARFIFGWDGTAVTAANYLQLHIQAGSELPDPKFLLNFQGGTSIFANVDNNDLTIVPEPATMSLLAIGLAALVARRRRSA